MAQASSHPPRTSVYEPGRRLAGDEARPRIDWVLYSAEVDGRLGVFAALYIDAALVRPALEGGWYTFDFSVYPPHKVPTKTDVIARARACWRPGWPLLPSQEGIL